MGGLLVSRTPIILERVVGEVQGREDLPSFLKLGPLRPLASVLKMGPLDMLIESLVLGTKENVPIEHHRTKNIVPGVYSGRRSVLVGQKKGELYRIKGVCAGWHPIAVDDSYVIGGQIKEMQENERKMSQKANAAFRKNGIETCMVYKGRAIYKEKAILRGPRGEKEEEFDLSAGIYKVKGDTRYDEYLEFLCRLAGRYSSMEAFSRFIFRFSYEVGLMSGKNLRVLHKEGISWSNSEEVSNSHFGNIVLFYEGKDNRKLHVGLVDFDGAIGKEELSKTEFEDLIEADVRNMTGLGRVFPPNWTGTEPRGYKIDISNYRIYSGELKLVGQISKGGAVPKHSSSLPFNAQAYKGGLVNFAEGFKEGYLLTKKGKNIDTPILSDCDWAEKLKFWVVPSSRMSMLDKHMPPHRPSPFYQNL